jgi:tetratricopeptide (TPR) repeat protein
MKTIGMKFFLAAFTLMLTLSAFAQKKNVQNAVMDFRAYEKAIQSQNTAGAKKSLMSAKNYIDLAAANAETAQDLKMYFFKGNVYLGLAGLAMMLPNDADLAPFANEETFQTGLDAWKTCFAQDTRGTYRDDIKMAVMMQSQLSVSMAGEAFANQDYQGAYNFYSATLQLYDIIGLNAKDNFGLVSHNAGLAAERLGKYDLAFLNYEAAAKAGYEPAICLSRAADALMKQGKQDEAMNHIIAASEKFPGDVNIIISMAEMALKTGKDELAISSLNKAIEKDPSNGIYHWAVGTVYQKLGRTEEAIAAYTKAISLSPKDDRPYFSLGSIHFNKAVDYLDQANKLRLGDPKFEELEAQAKEEFAKAAPFLEKVIEITGDAGNKDILTNLFTIHRKLDNSSKAMEYKKRADALK